MAGVSDVKGRDSEADARHSGLQGAGPAFHGFFPFIAVAGAALLLLFAPAPIAVATIGAVALIFMAWRRRLDADPRAPEKLLVFAAAFYLAVWLLSAWVHWQPPRLMDAAGYAALILTYPLWRAARAAGLGEGALWSGLAGTAAIAAALAAARLLLAGPLAAPGPPWWSDVAFGLGAMSLGAVDYGGRTRTGFVLLVGGVLGLMAALVAGVWGVWLALPVTVVVWFLHLPSRLPRQLRWAALLVVIVGIEAVLLTHGTGVLARFRWLILQSNVWWHSHGAAGLFGAVLHEWAVALAVFAAHPLIGAVPLPTDVDLNQYVLVLRDAGLLGALALALLLGVPARHFLRLGSRGDPAVSRVGRAGLLLVTAYGISGLLHPVFADGRALAFYVFALAALYAVARRLEALARRQPVTRRQTLSVTVITKNEADRLGRCLESVAGWADEIIVLDSGSTDATVELARRYTDQVEVTDWPGYGVQKQRALERATCDWVLSIDADEALSPDLRHDIDAALGETPACVGYRLPWAVVVYGKRLDFGRSSRAPLRLFRRQGARFTPEVVHETIALPPGKIGVLEGRLLHYTHRDFGHALEKSARYAWLGAHKRFDKGRRGGGLAVAALRSLWVFLQIYVLRGGFLDGAPGFLVAVTYMQGAFNKYAGLWALRREGHGSNTERRRSTEDD